MQILFICLGNICRSPLAAAILEAYVRYHSPELSADLTICSAGTYSRTKGEPADPRSMHVATMNEHTLPGVSEILLSHRASPVTMVDIDASDYILVMDQSNLSKIHTIIKNSSIDERTARALMKKVFLFGNFCKTHIHKGDPIIIEDPWYGSSSDFATVYNQCYLATKGFISHLTKAKQ